jgi:hypothetical protein
LQLALSSANAGSFLYQAFVVGQSEKEVMAPDFSPNGKEDTGSLPGAAWNNLDDQSDDAHLYLGKFNSFSKMVDVLIEKHGCHLVRKEISKLPKVNDGNKHRLADTLNPRCMATVELTSDRKSFVLLEVDTTDGAAKMSTMLLTSTQSWARDNQKEILHRIMKRSLAWPSDFFKEQLGAKNYAGMPHPQSKHSGGLAPEVIEPWAQRIALWIKRSS